MKAKKITEKLKRNWLKETSLTILLVAIIIVAFILITAGINALELKDIDLTESKLFTVTEKSKELIGKIPDEDKIQIYMLDYNENDNTVDLVKQYTKIKNNITVEVSRIADRQDLAMQYELYTSEDGSTYSQILIICGDKYKVIKYSDLTTYDYTNLTLVDVTEQRITNAILGVSSIGKVIQVYFLTGHEENTVEIALQTFKRQLELENYEVKELNIEEQKEIPEDCKTLIISSPTKDFTDFEKTKIEEYVKSGGNILWMNNPNFSKNELKNVNYILNLYGTQIDKNGVMVEGDKTRRIMDIPDLILPIIEQTEITKDLHNNGFILLVDSCKLSFSSDEELQKLGVTKTNILTTTDQAFFRKDLSIQGDTITESDEVGKQALGAILEKNLENENKSKLVIYANNAFVSDIPVTIMNQVSTAISLYNNADLILNSIAYTEGIEDRLVIRKNGIDTVLYTATGIQNTVILTIIFILPILIIGAGIVVWNKRRRKK